MTRLKSFVTIGKKEFSMAIPTFDNFIIPFLEELKDNQLHSMKEIKANIAKTFKLSEQDMSELTNSGYKKFDDRVGWARTYLKKSLLISSPERAKFRIEERGWQALKEKPQNILKYLKQYPEFLEFQGKDKNTLQTNNVQISECDDNQTPQDLIDKAKSKMQAKLEDDIMHAIFSKEKDDRAKFFEKLVTKLLCKMGYGGSEDFIIQKCGKSGDAGIDGIIKEDTLGLGKIHIQAKCYNPNHTVAAGDLRDFGGSLLRKKSPKAVFITTSSYTKPAVEYAKENDIILIDGKELLRLMIAYNVGVETKEIIELKKIDLDFFDDED